MAPKIRIHYRNIAQRQKTFADEENNITAMANKLKTAVDNLHHDGWKGRGSDAFYNDMEQVVIPALLKLALAFDHSQTALNEIHSTFIQAEQDAADVIKKKGGTLKDI